MHRVKPFEVAPALTGSVAQSRQALGVSLHFRWDHSCIKVQLRQGPPIDSQPIDDALLITFNPREMDFKRSFLRDGMDMESRRSCSTTAARLLEWNYFKGNAKKPWQLPQSRQ